MTNNYVVDVLDYPKLVLGEGPIWDAEKGRYIFVDAFGQKIHMLNPSTQESASFAFDSRTASLAQRESGGFIVALGEGICTFDDESGEIELITDPQDGRAHRSDLNDGKADPAGRFLVVGADLPKEGVGPLAALYSIGADGSLSELDAPFYIGNGPCWSPDGSTFYLNDSLTFTTYAYDYDLATGEVSNKRVLKVYEGFGGIPDGMTVDADGNLWVAICEGSKVVNLTPEGTVLREIEFPTTHITSVAFGGEELDELFVTSIDPESLGHESHDELGGSVFLVSGLGVRGLPSDKYKG